MPTSIKADLKTSRAVTDQKKARAFVRRATYKRLNGRRADLILRDLHDHDLTAGEKAELEELQEECGRVVDLAWRLPDLPEVPRG